MVILDPYEEEARMRFTASITLYGQSAKAYSRIDTIASPIFVSHEIVMAKCFYTDCKTAHKLAIKVDSEQRISTTKVVCP